jgi:flagellin
MSVSINTNTAASYAAANLGVTQSNLQKSLSRLSSGNRIVSSSDDAGGLGVATKMNAAIRRNDAAAANVTNAQSFLQTQDGALNTASTILTRMSELSTLAQDSTKQQSDLDAYALELNTLSTSLSNIKGTKFNGVGLFGTTNLNVTVSDDVNATQLSVTGADLGGALDGTYNGGTAFTSTTSADLSALDFDTSDATGAALGVGTDGLLTSTVAQNLGKDVATSLQYLANIRAQNGADSSALSSASDLLSVNKVNLEAAHGRIMDVDVAQESTQLARMNTLSQAGTAMLAQANQSSQSVLRLLQ